MFLELRVFDIALHAWDLARSIGVDDLLAPDLVDAVLGVVESRPAGMGSGSPRSGGRLDMRRDRNWRSERPVLRHAAYVGPLVTGVRLRSGFRRSPSGDTLPKAQVTGELERLQRSRGRAIGR
ncbi:MAG: hypothetical protein ACKVWR_03330 [Acidimicrobiales bacterium]